LGKYDNLPNKHLDIEMFNGDITNEEALRFFKRYGFDYIIHLAAFSSAPMFYENPSIGCRVNIDGFRNVLKLARALNSKIIYATTSSLYSNASSFKESAVLFPQTYYEYTKYCNEIEARLFYKKYGLKSVGLRFFSIYGYNEMHKNGYANLISQFLWEMENSKRPVIYGDGTQTRDFTWIGDVCKVIELIMTFGENGGWFNRILNVGTGKSHSLNQLVDILNTELKTSLAPVYVKNPIKSYVQHTCADVTRLKNELGYVPDTSLRSGIRKLIKRKTL